MQLAVVGKLQGADDRQQVHQDNAADVPSQNELKQALEKGNDEQKIETMVRMPLRLPLPRDPAI
jgi:hypothetical protein